MALRWRRLDRERVFQAERPGYRSAMDEIDRELDDQRRMHSGGAVVERALRAVVAGVQGLRRASPIMGADVVAPPLSVDVARVEDLAGARRA